MSEAVASAGAIHHEESFLRKYLFSKDHKTIGKQYLITGIAMAILGGTLAILFRINLAHPGFLTNEQYYAFVTYHGAIMFFWVAMPILLGGFGNILIPLMIGARDVAFPTLNMFSYWVFFVSSVILIISFFVPGGAFSGGWTVYPPLSADPERYLGANLGTVLFLLALALEFASMLMGGVNFITTALTMRAKGLTLMRLPIFVWMEVVASLLFLFSVTPLIAGAVMLLLDIILGTHFFRVEAGKVGDPVLWQHLFWFFGHPEVYVILFPALGILFEVITTYSRRPVFSYKLVVYAAIVAGILSFLVWAHHQFVAGINPLSATAFSVTTILISIPFSMTLVVMGLTFAGGSIRFTPAMLFAIFAFLMFIIGGLSGLPLGAVGSDIYFHDTYFVVTHFHYTVFTIAVLSTIAGICHWFPKMFGRKINETFGKIHAWLTFIFYNGFAFPGFFLGLAGHPRRYYSALEFGYLQKYQWVHELMTVSAVLLLTTQVVFLFVFFYSIFAGAEEKSPNPWKSTTLEWLAPSPPPHLNWGSFAPVVERGPYEYARNGKDIDYLPQGKLVKLKQPASSGHEH
ncbi:Alternative cytochrome c oxidase subunit 1 [bacterium HR19]|nr:Alternative cytochrome c oxidase subunit 1 [bacterium HR19]